jgi:FkbM family methyltransferase
MQPLPPLIVLAECAGLHLWFNLRDRMIGQAIAQGCYEVDVTKVVQQAVTPGMNCLDLGANLGYFTVMMGNIVGPAGSVHAFEPFPSNYELLSRNVRENHLEAIAKLHRIAAYDKSADCFLRFRSDDLNDNFGSMFVAQNNSSNGNFASLPCTAHRVDDVVPIELPIHFVKIDIEGSEVCALHGMTRILERDHPVIVVELYEEALAKNGQKPEDLVTFLQSLGYDIWDIKSGSALVLSPDREAKIYTNLLCTWQSQSAL